LPFFLFSSLLFIFPLFFKKIIYFFSFLSPLKKDFMFLICTCDFRTVRLLLYFSPHLRIPSFYVFLLFSKVQVAQKTVAFSSIERSGTPAWAVVPFDSLSTFQASRFLKPGPGHISFWTFPTLVFHLLPAFFMSFVCCFPTFLCLYVMI